MASTLDTLGSIVAFEGNPDTISTQLRLLPTSPQILLLPTVQTYLPTSSLDQDFDVPVYIRNIHDALVKRHQAARDFLDASTTSNKRLVFLNGGASSAYALCIRAIMKQETDGDYARAEAIFHHFVEDGLSGLETSRINWRMGGRESLTVFEDPITRAMRAADALDRQTESLQPPSSELSLIVNPRPRSTSLPLYGYVDNFGDTAAFLMFGASLPGDTPTPFEEAVESADMFATSIVYRNAHEKPADHTDSGFAGLDCLLPTSPMCIGETYRSPSVSSALDLEVLTPRSEVLSIRSTDPIIYGEASLLDVRISGFGSNLTRVKSLDRIYSTSPRYRDLCLSTDSPEPELEAVLRSRPPSCMIVANRSKSASSRVSYIEGPRRVVIKSSQRANKAGPVQASDTRTCCTAVSSYVDRGTDARDTPNAPAQFTPILPFVENLVICFRDGALDLVLEFVLRRFKTGSYPFRPEEKVASKCREERSAVPGTPEYYAVDEWEHPPIACIRSPEDYYSGVMDEYDPYAYSQPVRRTPKPVRKAPTLRIRRPPTPRQTPPPSVSEGKERFHDFDITAHQTAVTIQNSLRSILNHYFSPETQGYHHFQFALLPELEGLWKPVFREAEHNGSRKDKSKLDQILAIGAQRGVKKEFVLSVIGQLEKLATKPTGMSRSGRLDFRYLLANAMQAFTAQPLTSQTHDNPFTNSYLLATLIIPHLETYLALHQEVRFLLLEYPPEHLPTVLALQKLIGVDLVKVAQIVDYDGQDLSQFTHIRWSLFDTSETRSKYDRVFSSSYSEPTTSKANFLLTSTASEREISTFISTIWGVLAGISQFYNPEETSKKSRLRKTRPSPLRGPFSPFPKVTSDLNSPSLSPSGAKLGWLPTSPVLPSRTPSIAETIGTTRSIKSMGDRTKAKARRQPQHVAADAASLYTLDPDEDGDWDLEERRLMPMFMQKPPTGQPSRRKALKFLGLA